MASFHISLQGRGAEVADGEALVVPASAMGAPLPVSFDRAYAQLEALPKFFIEPDGAFAWVEQNSIGDPWRLDGCLYDGGPALQYVEIKGDCPIDVWDDFLAAFDVTDATAMIQFVRTGQFVSLTSFRDTLRAE